MTSLIGVLLLALLPQDPTDAEGWYKRAYAVSYTHLTLPTILRV